MLRMMRVLSTAIPVGRVAPRVLATRQLVRPAFTAAAPTLAGPQVNSRSFTSSFAVRAASTEDSATSTTDGETFTYQAEVDKLMDMIVNSLYSNKDVFLRELISNASDALDKARLTSLTDTDQLKTGTDLEIRIKCDPAAKTLTIEDTGIGMTKDDLMSSLGTIARSGTAKFAEAMKDASKAGDSNLIGQFGVGFYSAFLVADKVTVQTKNNDDDKAWVWESEAGSHSFSIKEDEGTTLTRGTRLTLHLKEDAEEMLDESKVSGLIKQYSEFISFPIKLWTKDRVPKQVEDADATKKAQEFADKKATDDGKDAAEAVEKVMKTEYEEVEAFKVQNQNKPIWTRSPKEVTDEEYGAFFKQTFKEFMDPMAKSHFNVEGTIEFSGLLFVPGMAPFDMMDSGNTKSSSIRLFVKRVFISDQFDDQLMPKYMSFIKGVIDSSDLPLNVSREILQESRTVRIIRKQLVKRALDMLSGIADKGDEAYEAFWTNFGRNIKMGIIEDNDNREKLAGLLRYKSTKSGAVLTSLDDYISRMKPEQKGIYFVAAESDELAQNSPFVEALVKKDFEVLYMTEPIDEWCAGNLATYKDNNLTDVSKEDLGLEDEDKEALAESAKTFKDLTEWMTKELEGKVSKVAVSGRLTDSPCILVTSKNGWSANMQRIMKSQPMQDGRAMDYMKGDKIMELNPDNAVVQTLNGLVSSDSGSARAKEIVSLMYETALLTSGFDLSSPRNYAGMVYSMMDMALAKGDSAAAPKAESKSEAVDADQIIEEK